MILKNDMGDFSTAILIYKCVLMEHVWPSLNSSIRSSKLCCLISIETELLLS